jgi:hypothetical protein
VDNPQLLSDNLDQMYPSVEEIVRDHMKAARKLRKENRDPAKSRAFLLRARIVEKTKKTKAHPNGLRLAKRFR